MRRSQRGADWSSAGPRRSTQHHYYCRRLYLCRFRYDRRCQAKRFPAHNPKRLPAKRTALMKRRFWRSGHSGARQVWKTSASPIGLASFCDAGHGAANNQGHRRREEFQLGRLVIQWFALRGQPEGALSRGTEMIRVAVCFAFMIGIVVRVSATGAVESEKIENVLSTAGLHAGLRTPGAAVLVVKNGTIAFKR